MSKHCDCFQYDVCYGLSVKWTVSEMVDLSTPVVLTVNFLTFPLGNFCETGQIVSKCFTLVGARFSRKFIRAVFFAEVKNKKSKKSKSLPSQTLLFFVFRIRIPLGCDFTEGN